MNVDGGILQTFEQTKVNKKFEINNDLQGLIVFKKSTKYLKYINLFFKRMIDIVGAIVGIAILIPLTIVVKIVNILNKDFGPLFYSQERIGQYGKNFKMYKFRSMVVDADEKLKELLEKDEEARNEYSTYKKLKDDPRVTPIGKFIRKTSLDEFPQFVNVLRGEMSLVGPRAYLPKEKEDMGDTYQIIITHKPGVTGLWQVTGRSDVTFKDRLEIDINYHQNSNFILDIKILLKTVLIIINKNGAE